MCKQRHVQKISSQPFQGHTVTVWKSSNLTQVQSLFTISDTRNKLFDWYLWHILTYSTVSPTLTSLLLKLKNNDMQYHGDNTS